MLVYMSQRYFIATILSLVLSFSVRGTELVDVTPLTDRILMLHFNEGHVIHHQRGQSRSDEKVIISPLDTEAASRPFTYSVSSPDDEHYRKAQPPSRVGRKSKGTDFAWFADQWENGHAVNTRPDHTKEHWIYLFIRPALATLMMDYVSFIEVQHQDPVREWRYLHQFSSPNGKRKDER